MSLQWMGCYFPGAIGMPSTARRNDDCLIQSLPRLCPLSPNPLPAFAAIDAPFKHFVFPFLLLLFPIPSLFHVNAGRKFWDF